VGIADGVGCVLRGGGMRDYPLDRFSPILFWPMEKARQVRSRLAKLLLVILYVPWAIALYPIMFVLLAVSVPMAIWDDVNR